MSTTSQDITPSGSSSALTGLKITSVLLVLGVILQAWLGSSGMFQGKPGRIDAHAMIANLMFLITAAQLVLAFLAFRKGEVSTTVVGIAVISVIDVVAQIGLGYSTRDGGAETIVWHITNGVLLMAINGWLAGMVNQARPVR